MWTRKAGSRDMIVAHLVLNGWEPGWITYRRGAISCALRHVGHGVMIYSWAKNVEMAPTEWRTFNACRWPELKTLVKLANFADTVYVDN